MKNEELKNAFMEAYGVRPFRYGYANLLSLLKQGEGGKAAVRKVMTCVFCANPGQMQLGDYSGRGAFDHWEFYGRDRRPLFLIGHPYQLGRHAHEALRLIRTLGMQTDTYEPSRSWYGHGAMLTVVYHPVTVVEATGSFPVFPAAVAGGS